MKKPLAFVLAMLLLLTTVFVGCTPDNTQTDLPYEETSSTATHDCTTPEETTPEQTTPEEEVLFPPTEKELTSVSIASGDSDTEKLAAAELQKHLEIKGVSISPEGFPIVLSIDGTLGDDAYRIVGKANLNGDASCEEYINITGGNGRGVFYGVVRFLEEYAGTRFFTYELETHTTDPVVLPETISIDYQPVFEYRYTSWNAMSKDPLFCVKSGMNGNHGGITDNMGGHLSYASGLGVHTLGTLSETTYPYPGYAPNPCLSDPEVLATVIKNVRAALAKEPNTNIISVSQTDKEEYCTCERCAAIDAEEGSPSGTMLRFVNAVADAIAEEYPNVIVDTLAYKYTRKAPTKTVPRDNVCVRLCSIECHFNHPLTTETCSICSAFREDIVAWNEICDNLYIWDYTTDFSYYLSFFPNLYVLRENMRFYAEHNVKGMFEQGNSQGPSGEFGELRAFLLAKLMMYPYMTEEEYFALMDEFLAAYYGGGWTYIRQYIDTLSEFALKGAGHTIYHAPFTAVTEYEYRALEYGLNRFWRLAEKNAGDRVEYVKRSRLHWRYTELMLNPDEEKALQFIKEVEGLGMAWREGRYHVNIQASELYKRPSMWVYM